MIDFINVTCLALGTLCMVASLIVFRGYLWLTRRGILRYHGDNIRYHEDRVRLKTLLIGLAASAMFFILMGLWGLQW